MKFKRYLTAFLLTFCIAAVLTGCGRKEEYQTIEKADVKAHVADLLQSDDFKLKKNGTSEGEDGLIDESWTVTAKDGTVFHVASVYSFKNGLTRENVEILEHGITPEEVSGEIQDDYNEILLQKLYASYTSDVLTEVDSDKAPASVPELVPEAQANGLVKAIIYAKYCDRAAIKKQISEIVPFTAYVKENGFTAPITVRMAYEPDIVDATPADIAPCDMELVFDEVKSEYTMSSREVEREFILNATAAQRVDYLREFTAKEIRDTIKNSNRAISVRWGSDGDFKMLDNVCANEDGTLSLDTMLAVLKAMNVKTVGSAKRFNFRGDDGIRFEFGYDMTSDFALEYIHEHGAGVQGNKLATLQGYVYMADGVVYPMEYPESSAISPALFSELTGIEVK